MEPELLETCTETVTVEPRTANTGGGSGTYGTGKAWKARIQEDNRLTRDREGNEVVSKTQLFMPPTSVDGTLTAIAVGDRLTLPAGYFPLKPPIISVLREKDETGVVHHFEVLL